MPLKVEFGFPFLSLNFGFLLLNLNFRYLERLFCVNILQLFTYVSIQGVVAFIAFYAMDESAVLMGHEFWRRFYLIVPPT